MDWSWSWWIFLTAWVVCTIVSQFSRGAMNAANIAEYGSRADYRSNFAAAFIGTVIAGAIYASAITVVAGFIL